ncbi:MAG: three-Cys-motif partner protein TcmP [Candidatus Zixiibacteriota bacterium]
MADILEYTVDDIGYWTELKLEMIGKYAAAYSKILSSRNNPSFYHVYIDAFAGAGVNISRDSGDYVPGSPLNALRIEPPFREYHLIDLNGNKITMLRDVIADFPNSSNAHIYQGDCNEILLKNVFPNVRYSDFRRGLCLLDPYGMHWKWDVIQKAGEMKSIDILLNFPLHDVKRNALRKNPTAEGIERMNALWGDETWQNDLFEDDVTLFGKIPAKLEDREVLNRFRERLQKVAGFGHVSRALPLRNSRGLILFYLMLASQKPVATDIVNDIVKKYWNSGVR